MVFRISGQLGASFPYLGVKVRSPKLFFGRNCGKPSLKTKRWKVQFAWIFSWSRLPGIEYPHRWWFRVRQLQSSPVPSDQVLLLQTINFNNMVPSASASRESSQMYWHGCGTYNDAPKCRVSKAVTCVKAVLWLVLACRRSQCESGLCVRVACVSTPVSRGLIYSIFYFRPFCVNI